VERWGRESVVLVMWSERERRKRRVSGWGSVAGQFIGFLCCERRRKERKISIKIVIKNYIDYDFVVGFVGYQISGGLTSQKSLFSLRYKGQGRVFYREERERRCLSEASLGSKIEFAYSKVLLVFEPEWR
jgi:hypothetical protein